MSRFNNFFRNAFGIGTEESTLYAEGDISPERKSEIIEKLAQEIVDRRLSVPTIFFLETVKPLSFLGSQVMVFLEPVVQSIFNFKSYKEVSLLLERRENVEILLQRIEKKTEEQ